MPFKKNRSAPVKPLTQVQAALIDWLDSPHLEVFATVTLNQGLRTSNGSWQPIELSAVIKTAWLLRDRLTRTVFGRQNRRFPFLVFHHDHGGDKRDHLHIVAKLPQYKLPDCEIALKVNAYSLDLSRVTAGLSWARERIDVQPITKGDARRVLSYGLRDGSTERYIDGFLPQASFTSLL